MATAEEKSSGEDGSFAYPKMEYRMMGATGLKVSVFGLGTMSFNDEAQSESLMREARAMGINFFDNAELYGEPCGNSEVLFGKALKKLQSEDSFLWRRSDLVITTKIFWAPNEKMVSNDPRSIGANVGLNEWGLSRKHFRESIDASLKRMQLDYVDVLYCHRYDTSTPVLEVVQSMTEIIRSGKAFYWGTSMWPQIKLVEAYYLAKLNGLIPPVVEQPQFSMLERYPIEIEYKHLLEPPYSLGTTVWSPLDSGILTGKYLDEMPEESRMTSDRLAKWFGPMLERLKKTKFPKVRKLKEEFADPNGYSLVNLALAWVIKHKAVSVCLLGASKASQLRSNSAALDLARKLTKADMDQLDVILDNKPQLNDKFWSSFFTNTLPAPSIETV